MALALLKAGGQELQQECKKVAPIKTGEVVATGPGKLPCHHVLHTVLPGYKSTNSTQVRYELTGLIPTVFVHKSFIA